MVKFLITILSISFSFSILKAQWIIQPANTTSNLFCCSFINSQTGWAGGDSGKIFHTTNGGNNWLNIYTQVYDRFESMVFLNNNIGIAGGYDGKMYRTTNGGYNWTSEWISTMRILDIFFINQTTGWCTGRYNSGSVFRTTNSGSQWFVMSQNTPGTSIWFINENTGLLTDYTTIYRTTNGGWGWYQVFSNTYSYSFQDLFFINSQTGYASGSNMEIAKTTNAGLNWSLICFDTSSYDIKIFYKIHFIDEMLGYGVGQGVIPGPVTYYFPIFYKTTNGGVNWTTVSVPYNNADSFEDICIVDGQTGYAVGYIGLILKSTNAGYVPVINKNSNIPSGFKLYQNYPNPFNAKTKIKFQAPLSPPEGGKSRELGISLIIYDILGREVASLIPPLRGGQEGLQPGLYEVEFDGSNFASGVYFYRLIVGDPSSSSGQAYIESKKMLMVK